jgi:hypothetical protein
LLRKTKENKMSTIPQSTTPRTDAAVRLTIGAGFNMVCPSFARELENELAEMSSIAEKWEDDALRYARNAEYWQTRAEKAEAELARLRADLERFTGHGLLDCHAICDQRDAAVAERDQLRAQEGDYIKIIAEVLKCEQRPACEQPDNQLEAPWEVVARLRAQNDQFSDNLSAVGKAYNAEKDRAEKAEADTARMDWLEKEALEDWGIRSIDRAIIDKAMKEASK